VSYTFNARPEDAGRLILIWAEIWGVDIQFGGIDAPTGAIFGDQVHVIQPLALRLDPSGLRVTGLTPEKRYTLEISPDTRNWGAGLVFVATTNTLSLPLSYTENQTFFRVRQH